MAKQQQRLDGSSVATIKLMAEGGVQRIPADSLQGNLYRPNAQGWPGARTATLETLFDFWINNVPDPDSALEQDPDFDEKLRQQPDVHACMTLRELTVASMPAHFEPSSHARIDKNLAKTVAEFCDDVFNRLPNRPDLYRQMQNAVLMGGQGIEWIWARNNVEGTSYERPVEYHPIHKTRFVFDRLGNMALLTRETPVWGTYVAPSPNRMRSGEHIWPTPPGKFMYHRYKAEGGPWTRPASEGYVYWGRGEDTNLFIPVTFDQFVLRFRMKWLEKHGMPLTLLYYPDSEALKSEVLSIAKAIRGESIVTIPRPAGGEYDQFYHVEFVSPPELGADVFSSFSEEWTKPRIEKIILGGANLLEVGDRGSYAATVDQRDEGASIIFRWDAKNIDTTIDLQCVPAMVQARFPGIPEEYYPHHKLTPEVEKNRAVEMEVIQAAAQLVPIREEDVYEACGYSRPKDDEAKVFLGQAPGGAPGQGFDNFPTPLSSLPPEKLELLREAVRKNPNVREALQRIKQKRLERAQRKGRLGSLPKLNSSPQKIRKPIGSLPGKE